MKRITLFLLVCMLALPAVCVAQEDITPVPFTNVKITDTFWKQRLDTLRSRMIRYAFQKCEEAGQIENFAIAGRILSGETQVGDEKFQSYNPYDDAEVYKVLEGASYLLKVQPDAELESYVDGVVDKIVSAQEPDGYLMTNWTIHNPLHDWFNGEKWTSDWNLSHETFNMGELIEAGIAYYQATGKDKLLNAGIKAANLMCEVFNENGIKMAPGHAVVEMALTRLYEQTGDERYLDECLFFLNCRGVRQFDPTSDDLRVNGKYWQDHLPAVEQREAVGHAVRALYFYSGMADIVRYRGYEDYQTAIDAIWENICSKKLYLTGGLGARYNNEAFGENYELPNGSAYCETCASVASCMFNLRMFRLHGDSKYIDLLERTFYNNVLSGMSIYGTSFFYPNGLQASKRGQSRSEWFGTSCCPTNLSRLIPSMPGYVYATTPTSLYVNLYTQSTMETAVGTTNLTLSQTTEYPWEGQVSVKIDAIDSPSQFALRLRIPGWAQGKPVASDLYTYQNADTDPIKITVNGTTVDYQTEKGYAVIERTWSVGDEVSFELPMTVHRVECNSQVETNQGLVAFERGPIVYCAEPTNSFDLDHTYVPESCTISESKVSNIVPGEVVALVCRNVKQPYVATDGEIKERTTNMQLIPYYCRAYRGARQMKVWIDGSADNINEELDYIDRVIVANSTSESAHNLKSYNSNSNTDLGWRDAANGWYSYDMKVLPDQPCEVVLTHWGDDGGKREFDIYADGEKFSYDHVNGRVANSYYDVRHAIPYHLTKGKEKITIKLQARDDNNAGGIFNIRTRRIKETPEGATVTDFTTNSEADRTAHNFTSNGDTGNHRERIWADGSGSTGLSFDMACESGAPSALMILYWGDESDLRDFEVRVDETVVGSEQLLHNHPNEFFWSVYSVPAELTQGKSSVRVHLSSTSNTKVGGYFYAYMLALDDATSIASLLSSARDIAISTVPGAILLTNNAAETFKGQANVYTQQGACQSSSRVNLSPSQVESLASQPGMRLVVVCPDDQTPCVASKVLVK